MLGSAEDPIEPTRGKQSFPEANGSAMTFESSGTDEIMAEAVQPLTGGRKEDAAFGRQLKS